MWSSYFIHVPKWFKSIHNTLKPLDVVVDHLLPKDDLVSQNVSHWIGFSARLHILHLVPARLI